MHTTSKLLLSSLALCAVVLLGACDTTGETNAEWKPGSSLSITPAADEGFAPATTRAFIVEGFTVDKEYSWSVSPEPTSSEVLRRGQRLRVTFDEPGTYTVTVTTQINGEEVTGTSTVAITSPTVATQVGRLPQFAALNTALGASSVSIPDSAVTLLAPSNEALVAQFDSSGNDAVEAAELPADSVLTDILETHVIPQTVTPEEVGSGPFTTAEGQEVRFEVSGNDTTVVVENDMGDVISQASVSATGLPIEDGIIYTLDGLLTPASAEVQFNDQTSADGRTVTVRSVYLPDGGFVAIHDSTLTTEDDATGSVIGVSEKLDPGLHNSVTVELFEETQVPGATYTQNELQEDQTLIAMPHRDNPDDGIYEFVLTGGSADGAYTEDGEAVIDQATVTVAEE